MENKKKQQKIEGLFRDARKTGYPGSFNDFVGKFYPEELTQFANDTGAKQQPQVDAPVVQEPVVQEPVVRQMYAPPLPPAYQVSQPQRNETGNTTGVPVVKSGSDDDKILGMNKYLFYALLALLVIGGGTGLYLLFIKPKAIKLEAGGQTPSAVVAGVTPGNAAAVSGGGVNK